MLTRKTFSPASNEDKMLALTLKHPEYQHVPYTSLFTVRKFKNKLVRLQNQYLSMFLYKKI